MTAPLGLRDYFASVGSGFSKQDAEVIGPQIEAMAEDGSLDTKSDEAARRTIVDTAQSANSPLHRYFEWDDAKAADLHRLDHAGKMLRSIRIKVVEDDRPKVRPVYKLPSPAKSVFSRGHNVLHGDSAFAVQKAAQAMDDLTTWRAKYQPYIAVWKDFAQRFRASRTRLARPRTSLRHRGWLTRRTRRSPTCWPSWVHAASGSRSTDPPRQHGRQPPSRSVSSSTRSRPLRSRFGATSRWSGRACGVGARFRAGASGTGYASGARVDFYGSV